MMGREINIKKIDNGYIMEVNGFIERDFNSPVPVVPLYPRPSFARETKSYKDLDALFARIREIYENEHRAADEILEDIRERRKLYNPQQPQHQPPS